MNAVQLKGTLRRPDDSLVDGVDDASITLHAEKNVTVGGVTSRCSAIAEVRTRSSLPSCWSW